MFQHSLKKTATRLIPILLVPCLSGCGATAGIEPSKVTCNQFLTQLKAGQFKSAHNQLSSKCKAVTTPQQVQNYWDLVQKNRGKVQSWSQQSFRVYSGTGGTNVILGYGLTCAKGNSGVTFTCVEENQKWLIQGFNFQG